MLLGCHVDRMARQIGQDFSLQECRLSQQSHGQRGWCMAMNTRHNYRSGDGDASH